MSNSPVSPTPDTSSSHQRRRSSINFQTPPSPREKSSYSHGKRSRCNFHFIKVEGLPSGIFNQYRISIKVGDDNKVARTTSWKLIRAKNLLVHETSPTFNTFSFSKITLQVESRFKLQSLIAESEPLTMSDLWKQQDVCGLRDPFTVQLTNKGNAKAVKISLIIRRLDDTIPQDHDRKGIAKNLYDDYPEHVSKAVKALEDLHARASTTSNMHMPISMTFYIIHQTWKYIQENERQQMTYDVEDNIWEFLNIISKEVSKIKTCEEKFTEYLPLLLTVVLRGFRLLKQIHHTHGDQLVDQLQSLVKEARHFSELEKSEVPPSIAQLSAQYPETLKHLVIKFPEAKGRNHTALSENSTFQELIKWITDTEPENNVFWLHGKLDTGLARNQPSSTLVHGLKDIGLPFGYFSLGQNSSSSDSTEAGKKVEYLFDSMVDTFIYQLSSLDNSLADAFNQTSKLISTHGTGNLYDRFQIFFQTLLSLDHQEYQPIVLIIDDLDFPNSASTTDYDALLNVFSTASASMYTSSPTPSADSITMITSISPSSSSSSIQVPTLNGLPFPSFLRIIVLSRSLGSKPSLIEQFAYIRDGHHLFNARQNSDSDNAHAARLYQDAIEKSSKGKGKGKAITKSIDKMPLIPIAEVDSQMGEVQKL